MSPYMATFAKLRMDLPTSVIVHNMTWKGIKFCQNYPPDFSFKLRTDQGRKCKHIKAENTCSKKISLLILLPSVSVGCADWLLFLRLDPTVDAWIDRKVDFTKFVLFKPCFAPFAFTRSTHSFLRFYASRQSPLNKISVIPLVGLLSCYIPALLF